MPVSTRGVGRTDLKLPQRVHDLEKKFTAPAARSTKTRAAVIVGGAAFQCINHLIR